MIIISNNTNFLPFPFNQTANTELCPLTLLSELLQLAAVER